MPRKARTTRQRKPRSWLRRIVVGTFVAGAVVAALLVGYIIYLDRLITGTFEGRRWTLPARVYAQPLELYLGRMLRPEDLAVELRRLGYRAATSGHPGTFFRRGSEMRIHTRAFTFDDGPRPE